MKREFYLVDRKRNFNKFWIIELDNKSFTTINGRIGTKVRKVHKEFSSAELAKDEYDKLINSKLKKGYIEGSIKNLAEFVPMDWTAKEMSEEVFWEIVSLFDWRQLGNDEAVMKPAIKALSQMSEESIFKFKDLLAEKLFALDTMEIAKHIGEDAYVNDNTFFSVDTFLYARCVVVANGVDLYKSVLDDPTKMPKDLYFEGLLYLSELAYTLKTGREMDYITSKSYETFSNVEAWQ